MAGDDGVVPFLKILKVNSVYTVYIVSNDVT